MKLLIGLTLLAFSLTAAAATPDQYKLTDESVELRGNAIELIEFQGRQALKIKRGRAVLPEVSLLDGTIEFDMWLNGARAFAYVQFRLQSDSSFEEVYFRSHKSSQPDAAQYSPVFQRRSSWQLYHGPGGTASVALPADQWIPVKIELQGKRLALTVGQSEQAALVVETLGHQPHQGAIAFRGFVPGTSDAEYAGYFSNVRVSQSTSLSDEAAASQGAETGVIRKWKASEVFDPNGPLTSAVLDREIERWVEVPTLPNGVVEFLRHLQIPENQRGWATVAQVTLNSPATQTCALKLGFSDEIVVGLDGRPMLYTDASYSFDEPRRQGLLHPDQAVVFLPLKPGRQTLSAAVADRFGGWGLYGQLEGCPDVKVE